MLNIDVNFAQMSVEELDAWLQDAYNEKFDAYEQDNIKYANQIDMLIDMVKNYRLRAANPDAVKESFTNYARNKYINEHTETGESCGLVDIDENLLFLKESLPDLDVDVEVTGLAQENTLTELDPIVVDIAFDLPYLDEQQHIMLTYETSDVINVDLTSIPKGDYKSMNSEDGTIISFEKLTNLSDELADVEFTETIEWPFEIKFKSTTASAKFAKAKTLAQKIILLLGKDKLINKVDEYKSTHQTGSNRATREGARAAAEAEAIRRRVNATGGRTKSQILKDMIEQINGVSQVTVSDTDNDIYYKKFSFRVTANNTMYEILMARTLDPAEIERGVKPFVCRMLNDQERSYQCDTHDQVITWLVNIVNAEQRRAATAGMTARERQMQALRNR